MPFCRQISLSALFSCLKIPVIHIRLLKIRHNRIFPCWNQDCELVSQLPIVMLPILFQNKEGIKQAAWSLPPYAEKGEPVFGSPFLHLYDISFHFPDFTRWAMNSNLFSLYQTRESLLRLSLSNTKFSPFSLMPWPCFRRLLNGGV